MASKSGKQDRESGRLPWPAVVILAALAVLGAVRLLQWTVNTFAWLISAVLLIVVSVALAAWVVSFYTRR